jgi:hypothetical protein
MMADADNNATSLRADLEDVDIFINQLFQIHTKVHTLFLFVKYFWPLIGSSCEDIVLCKDG